MFYVKKSPRTAAHIFVSPGDAPAIITQYVAWMERQDNSMLTNCLAACTHLTITVSEIEWYICKKKSSFYHTPLHSTPPLGGFPSEYRHPLWDRKTRMVSLPDGETISKTCLFVLTWSTNVTDGQTDGRTLHDSIDRACIASPGKSGTT